MSCVGATLKFSPRVSTSASAPKYDAICSGLAVETKRPHMRWTIGVSDRHGVAVQRSEVPLVEVVEGRIVDVVHRRFEALDRILRAFRVGIVGREHEQVGTGLFDHPPHGL